MNKVYKVVFNKMRGTMMVVNEATSSHQVGKKAAVAVAVAGCLASGIALANEQSGFPITGEKTLDTATKWESDQKVIVKDATLDLNGNDLTVISAYGTESPDTTGVLDGNVTINNGGKVVIKQTGVNTALGYNSSVNIAAQSIDISTSHGWAIYQNNGTHTLKADEINIVGGNAVGIYVGANKTDNVVTPGKLEISDFKTLNVSSESTGIDDGYAINNQTGVLHITGENVSLKSDRRGALATMDEGESIFNINNLTVQANIDNQSESEPRKTSAVHVSKGKLYVTSKDLISIKATKSEGQKGANGINVDKGGSLTFSGKTIEIDSAGRGMQVVNASSVAVVGGKDTESIHIKAGDIAVYALGDDPGSTNGGGQITLNAKKLNIEAETASGWLAGLWAQSNTAEENAPDKASKIVVNAADTTITAKSGTTLANNNSVGGIGIVAMSNGTVEVNGNLKVDAEDAILTRGYSNILINQNGNSTVQLTGNIDFNYDKITSGTVVDSTVKVKLSNADSFWNGRSLATSDKATDGFDAGEVDIPNNNANFQIGKKAEGLVLDISNGGTWNVTDKSFVTTLTLANGGKIQLAEGATVETLNVNNLTVSGDNNFISLPKATATFNQMNVGGALNLDVATVKGSIGVNNKGSLTVGTITNAGNLTVNNGGNLTIGTKITNSGSVTLEEGSTVTALLKGADLSSGTVTLIDGGTLDNKSELTENGIYDISWKLDDNDNKTGDINVKTKSAEQIVSDINVSQQQAGTVAAILPTIMNAASAPASSLIAQIADALGTALQEKDSQAVAQIAEDLAPSTAPVVSSISQGVNNAIAGVANARMAANRAAGDVFTGGSAWVQMIYNSADQDATKKSAKLESDTYGVTVGVDGKIGNNLTIGAGFGVTKTDAESGTRDIDVDSYSLFGYTEYNADNGWYVNGMATAIRGRYEETKVPAGIKLTAKYHTTVLGAGVATGYHFENGISPEVGLRYLRTHQGTYNDGAQEIHTDGTNLLTASLGAKYEKAFEQGDWLIKPTARVAATYDVVSDDTESAIRVIGGGQYHIISEHQKRAAFEAGLGLEASNGDWDFSVGYNGEFRSHFKSHTGMIKAKYNF